MNLETINWVDVILGGAVIISALVGIARGLIKEVLSLLTWLVHCHQIPNPAFCLGERRRRLGQQQTARTTQRHCTHP